MIARCIASCVLLIGSIAHAEPTIALVATRGAPVLPALASQIELHAGRAVVVHAIAARDVEPMTFGERASQLVASGEATVVVWIAPVERGFLVLAAGAWPGRALVELVRVDAGIGAAEIERTVALKVAGLLDALLAPHVGARAALDIVAAPPPEWRLEVAGLAAREAHQRGVDGRVVLAASRTWTLGPWLLAPALAGYWQPTGPIDQPRGRASVTEVGGAVALEAGRPLGSLELFARPRFVAAVLRATGVTRDDRRGDAWVIAPYAGLEAGLRRALSETLRLGVVAGAEAALVHHELQIDGETVVDLGRVRVHVGLSLTMSL